jgi:hypothetical protein
MNYLTPAGFQRLRAELDQLLDVERPKVVAQVSAAAALGDRSENADYIYGKRRLREIDRRIHFLGKRLEDVEVIDPEKIDTSKVVFGAWVQVKDEDDKTLFVECGEEWWWGSNRLIPINIVLKEPMRRFSYTLKTYSTKDFEMLYGHQTSLVNVITKRTKRRQISLVRKLH